MSGDQGTGLTRLEARAALSLAGIFALRMLGLFMIYPVFAIYARNLQGATPMTVGLALGIYGLTQALLQIPFGMLSDRFGRKTIITVGLLLFAAGSVVAAVSHSIAGVILGRAAQGTGAVGSVILALGADLTREEHRTKAMAVIGMTIGLSFAFALVAGPIVDGWIGVPGIFWLTAGLALVGVAINWFVVPRPVRFAFHRDTEAVPGMLKGVLADAELLRLDFGVLVLHAILTASFLGVPHVLQAAMGQSLHAPWFVYLPVLAVSVVIMIPLIIIGEKYRRMKEVFVGAVAALALSQVALGADPHSVALVLAALVVFFSAFNVMEASLPSLVSKAAPADAKGTAMGVYSSCQFFGIFLGGTLGGWAFGQAGLAGLFGFTFGAAALWFVIAATMRKPGHYSSYLLPVGRISEREARTVTARLRGVRGVVDAVVVADEGVAYLKVDRGELDEPGLQVAAGSAPA
jgi:MFS family permease